MMERDYDTTMELYNMSSIDLLTLSIPQKSLLLMLFQNMQNNVFLNTFIRRDKNEKFGLTPILLLLIKYCNDYKNIVVVCKTRRQTYWLFNECQKILKDRFMKIKENKVYFLDDHPVLEYDFYRECIKSDQSNDILHCITFCQKPDFTFKALFIWMDGMYSEMKYYPDIFNCYKSIWILSIIDHPTPELYKNNSAFNLNQ